MFRAISPLRHKTIAPQDAHFDMASPELGRAMFRIVVEADGGQVLGQLPGLSSAVLALKEVSALRPSFPPGAIIRVYAAGKEMFSVDCGGGRCPSFP